MSTLEATVKRCTEIEECLRSLGSTGSGISELTDNISSRLPTDLQQRIRQIATVRNRFVHEHGYTLPPSEEVAFLSELDSVVMSLVQLGATVEPLSPLPDKGTRMPQSNPWVEIHPVTSLRMRMTLWPSTPEKRLVFFRGSVPDVRPAGQQHTLPLTRVTSVAHVRMAPARIVIDKWAILTADQIPMAVQATAAVRPRSDDLSIARLASDGMRSTSTELELLEERAFRAVTALVSSSAFLALPNQNEIQNRAEAALRGPALLDLPLEITGFTIVLFQAADARLREKTLEHLTARIQLKHLENSHKLESSAAAHRRAESELDLCLDSKRLAAHRTHEHAVALDSLAIETMRQELELKRLEMEHKTKITLAEIQRDAEVQKAERTQIKEILPLIVKAAMAEGSAKVTSAILGRQLGIHQLIETRQPDTDTIVRKDSTATTTEHSETDDESSHEPPTTD